MVLVPSIKPPKHSKHKSLPHHTVNGPVHHTKIKVKSRQFWSTRRKVVVAVCLILFGIVGVGGGIAFAQGKALYAMVMAAKEDLTRAKAAADKKNFAEVNQQLVSAQNHLEQAQAASDKMKWLKWLPVVSTQFKAVDSILLGGVKIASAGQDITVVAEDIFSAWPEGDASFNSISLADRKALLAKVEASPAKLTGAQTKLNDAVMAFDQIPERGVIGPLGEITGTLREKLPLMKEVVQKALPILEVAPEIVGYPEEQTYLFLLQNNWELRATGGFIGTYGILVLQAANIEKFQTDNIYNLDEPVKHTLHRTPPEPLGRYLKIDQWFMRDSNWDPDFPTTARTAEDFYHAENGPIENIDGVLSVTPSFIQDLMELTGPVTLDGVEFNSNNLIEELEYQSEVGYRHQGLLESERKVVIGKLATILKDKLLNLPSSQWGKLWEVLLTNLDEKHVLIYSKDEQAQALVQQLEWDGAMVDKPGDYLMVVDSNLAALKTDKVMVKTINRTLSKEGDDYIVNLELVYNHTGVQDNDFITRYRTYTRVYVPRGSALLDSNGFLTNSEFEGGKPIQAETKEYEPNNKTVFEGFISVEAKSTKKVTLRYKLPPEMTNYINHNRTYALYLQKQPGTTNVTLNSSIDFGEAITAFSPVDKLQKIGDNRVQLSTPFAVDQVLSIDFK